MKGNLAAKRVVVTGMGVLTPIGCGTDAFTDGMQRGRSGISLIEGMDVDHLPSRMAGQIHDFNPADHLAKRDLKRTDRFTQLGLAAARMAWENAAMDSWPGERNEIGICLGTGIGGISTYEKIYDYITDKSKKMQGATYAIPRIMNNAVGSIIAEQLGLNGPNLTVNAACSSGANAIGMAFEEIRRGSRELVICGGTDAPIAPKFMETWCLMRVLSKRNEMPEQASRPFDKDRDGLVMAEGAGVLILESLESAVRRDVAILGEIVGFAANCSASDLIAPHLETQVTVMKTALSDAALLPGKIDYINAHGTSTLINDRLEAATIKAVFGDQTPQIPASSIKSMIGHAMGASSAIDAVATLLALKHGFLPPTTNYLTPDPDCDLDVVPNQSRLRDIETAISPSFAFGGNNTALVMKKWKTETI